MDLLQEALPGIERERPDYYHSAILLLNDHRELTQRAIKGLAVSPSAEQDLTERLLTLGKALSVAPLPKIPVGNDPLGPVLDGTTPRPEIRREGAQPAPPVKPGPRVNWRAMGLILFVFIGLAVTNVFYEKYQRNQQNKDRPHNPGVDRAPGQSTESDRGVEEDYRPLRERIGNLQLHADNYRKLIITASGDRGRTPDYKFTLDEFIEQQAIARGSYFDSNTRELGKIELRFDRSGRVVTVTTYPAGGGQEVEVFTDQ